MTQNKTTAQKIVYYVLLVAVSALFLVAAYSKLTANPGQEAAFTVAHLPVWFMYFIGVCELLGVIGLWMPKLQKLAACGLSVILVGAIVVTAVFVSVPEALFPLVTLVVIWVVVKLGKKGTAASAAAPVSVPPVS
jgi:putative oxidoreductase